MYPEVLPPAIRGLYLKYNVVNRKGLRFMFNRTELLTKAWADYRHDAFRGRGVRQGGPFDRTHFAYCLRMAWAVAKELTRAAKPKAAAPTKVVAPTVAARVEAIHSELMDLQMDDFAPWVRHAALTTELASLAA